MSTETQDDPATQKKPQREIKSLSVLFWLWLYVTFMIGNNALVDVLVLVSLNTQNIALSPESIVHAIAMIGATVGMIGLATTKEARSKMRTVRKVDW